MAAWVVDDGRDVAVERLARRAVISAQRAIGQLTGWRRHWAEPFLRQLTTAEG
jgi:uncharacterized protein (DUF305 family)